jgi:hypothetical protein
MLGLHYTYRSAQGGCINDTKLLSPDFQVSLYISFTLLLLSFILGLFIYLCTYFSKKGIFFPHYMQKLCV